MSPKVKNIMRKSIYAVLFIAMIAAFIYLSEKYSSNSDKRELVLEEYYENINPDNYKVVNGRELISLLKDGKHVIFIGSRKQDFSKKYMEELDKAINNTTKDKVYYYDIVVDKAQKNSNYYEIRDLLKGYLISTDGSENNLLAPSLYIVDNGKVKYYNAETVAMKNTDKVSDYWTSEKEALFQNEIISAINKYYLNK